MVVIRRSNRRPERVPNEMERAFRSLLPLHAAAIHHGGWRPATEVFETARGLTVTVELAGINPAALEIAAHEDLLVVSGRRENDGDGAPRRYREAGIAYGKFSTQIHLPWPADIDSATAAYTDGLLRIQVPRLAPQRIAVRRSDAPHANGANDERTNE
jgi:HSP20 family molecular chaperone IbpA